MQRNPATSTSIRVGCRFPCSKPSLMRFRATGCPHPSNKLDMRIKRRVVLHLVRHPHVGGNQAATRPWIAMPDVAASNKRY